MQAFNFGRPKICQFFSYLESLEKRSPLGPVRLKLLDRRPSTSGSADLIEVYCGFPRVDGAIAENMDKLPDAACRFVALQRQDRKVMDFQGSAAPKKCSRLNCDAVCR